MKNSLSRRGILAPVRRPVFVGWYGGLRAVSAAVLLALLAVSCASQRVVRPSGRASVFFPPPPDSARVQFLTSISSSRDIRAGRSFLASYVLGEDEERVVNKPYGLALRRGRLYICDTILNGLVRVEFDKRELNYFIPSGPGRLKKPINCCIDSDGRLYVADTGRGQVVVFDAAGNYLCALGDPEKERPTDVAVADGRLWVVDLASHAIRVYSLESFTPLGTLPREAAGGAEYLYTPTNIAVQDSLVYVSDMGDCRVKVFNYEGALVRTVGARGLEPGRFTRPKGVAVDSEGNIFVVDNGFENVQIFDRKGRPLMFFGGSFEGPGRMWLPAKVAIDESNLDFFKPFVDPGFELKRLIFVTNQYGPDKIGVYGLVKQK